MKCNRTILRIHICYVGVSGMTWTFLFIPVQWDVQHVLRSDYNSMKSFVSDVADHIFS